MDVVAVQILSFGAVALLVVGIAAALRGEKSSAAKGVPPVFRAFSKEIETLGRLIGPALDRSNAAQARQLQQDLIAAHLAPLQVQDIRGLQGLAALGLGCAAGVTVFLLSADWRYGLIGWLAMGLMGWSYPVAWLHGAAGRRKDVMSRSLPYAIDLITVGMQAGQDFGAAVRNLVVDGPPGPLRQEFAVMLRETELGKSRIEALKAMADRIQLDEFRSLVTSVVQSSEMGASIAQTLKVQAEEIRRARHHKAERQAARAPSLMIIPVALFILPSVFVMIFVPIILRIQGSGIGGFMGR
jgi:tight adherence protein C